MSDWIGTDNEIPLGLDNGNTFLGQPIEICRNSIDFLNWSGRNLELSTSLSKLSDDFSESMITQIDIFPLLSKNKFGQPVYGYATTVMGIVIKITSQKSDSDSENVDSGSKIFIDGNVEIEESSKILFNGLTPMIKKITELPDENGIYAKMIIC